MLFFLVIATLDVALHAFIFWRLIHRPRWPHRVQRALFLVTAALAASIPLSMYLLRRAESTFARGMAELGMVWIGVMFLLLVAIVTFELLLLLGFALDGSRKRIFPAKRDTIKRESVDIDRRVFLAKGVSVAAVASTSGLSGLALKSGFEDPEIREVNVRLDRLSPALSGFTIVQLTDVHIGLLQTGTFLERVVERTNRLRPDLVAITGDLVDGDVSMLKNELVALSLLRARFGVYFVTGNHERYSGVDPWVQELQRLGLRVLRNERVRIGDAASFDLAGLDDVSIHSDLSRALVGRHDDREIVLLAHQPRVVDEASAHGIGLQLSGHTHGGQIWPFGALTNLVQPYLSGLHRHGKFTQIYVSRGTGFWGPPMRLWAPSEISKIVLST